LALTERVNLPKYSHFYGFWREPEIFVIFVHPLFSKILPKRHFDGENSVFRFSMSFPDTNVQILNRQCIDKQGFYHSAAVPTGGFTFRARVASKADQYVQTGISFHFAP
jgi:hypothetical protein